MKLISVKAFSKDTHKTRIVKPTKTGKIRLHENEVIMCKKYKLQRS